MTGYELGADGEDGDELNELRHLINRMLIEHLKSEETGAIEAAKTDPLLAGLPERFAAQSAHRQSVRRLPEGAVLLAGNRFEPHHAYRIGERAWGVQFHPEFSADAMRCYIDTLAPSLSDAGRDVQALRTGVRDTPDAAALLGRFARLCSAPAG